MLLARIFNVSIKYILRKYPIVNRELTILKLHYFHSTTKNAMYQVIFFCTVDFTKFAYFMISISFAVCTKFFTQCLLGNLFVSFNAVQFRQCIYQNRNSFVKRHYFEFNRRSRDIFRNHVYFLYDK